MYHEARGEDLRTQMLVAAVVLERATKKEHNTVCKALYYPKAFSGMHRGYKPHSQKVYKGMLKLSAKILSGKVKLEKGLMYFNREHLGKRHKTNHHIIRSGKMIFY